jgi:hypothetical protein
MKSSLNQHKTAARGPLFTLHTRGVAVPHHHNNRRLMQSKNRALIAPAHPCARDIPFILNIKNRLGVCVQKMGLHARLRPVESLAGLGL